MHSNSARSRASHVAATNAGIVTIAAIGSFLLWRSRHPRHHRVESTHDEQRGHEHEHRYQHQNQRKREHHASDEQQRGRLTLQHQMEQNGGALSVSPIGHVRSVYRLCVGTPRQGLLAPNSRGRIEILPQYTDAFDGLQDFSHIWIVFAFHLNTINNSSTKAKKSTSMKIAPPALGGKKVGVLATRSPHRPNPIGITLCKVDQVLASKGVIHVSGLDLVDGTPIVDVKPYVSNYDSPEPTSQHLHQSSNVPSWVSEGLATRRPVHIEPKALQQLRDILHNDDNALEFYKGPTAFDDVTKGIEQVLSVDVRSAWQTKKVRQGQSKAQRASRLRKMAASTQEENSSSNIESTAAVCTQQLDNLLIHFTVAAPQKGSRSASEGSGAEDSVVVHAIQLLIHLTPVEASPPESRELEVPNMEGNSEPSGFREDTAKEGKNSSDSTASVEEPPDPPALDDPEREQDKASPPASNESGEEEMKKQKEANHTPRINDTLEKENKPVAPTDGGASATQSASDAKSSQPPTPKDDPTNNATLSNKSTTRTSNRESPTLKAQSPTLIARSPTLKAQSTLTTIRARSSTFKAQSSPTLNARSPALKAQSSSTLKARSPTLKSLSPTLRPMRPRGSHKEDSPSGTVRSSFVFSTMDTSSSLLQTHSSSASLSSLSPDAVCTAPRATSEPKPTDADYSVLKTYWNAAAQKNTPQGLVPEAGDELAKSSSASAKKLFGGAKVGSFGP